MISGLRRTRCPLFLASVRSAVEARVALSAGANLIDCKDPSKGALGALSASEIASVVDAVARCVPVSATVGDLPTDAGVMIKAARETAALGVDIVKVGFFGDGPTIDAIRALGRAPLGAARLVAVVMADREPDLGLVAELARAGFAGVMLDTADKASGSLVDILDASQLTSFVLEARSHGLAVGLAGSLRLEHVAPLAALGPDIIGFRGALCDGSRQGRLEKARVADVRHALDATAPTIETFERSVA